MELAKNQEHTVTIEGYGEGGMGVARIDGRVVFVHGALRGEKCRVLILKTLKSVAFAKVLEVLEPSSERITPDCPYFPRCGGCTYRHIRYEEELRLKKQRVQDNLSRIGGSDVTVEEILGAQDTLRYRNKAQYPVSKDGAVGFYRARTHEVIECEHCLLVKPEADAAWQELAALYTEQTGVPVKVVTAASGEYSSTLTAEMDKSAPPTLFVVGNQAAVDTWGDYCYDLSGTAVANELNTDAYNLYDADGKLCSIGYCYECYGIIVNEDLLEKAGYTLGDITNFETLKAVAEDIHARASELGFDAFTSSSMSDDSSWRFTGHLANLEYYYESVDDPDAWKECPSSIKGTYMQNYKNLWDLYINNSAVNPADLAAGGFDAADEFGKEQAVFYQNGSWEYANVSGEGKFSDEQLAMIPIYFGVGDEANQGTR